MKSPVLLFLLSVVFICSSNSRANVRFNGTVEIIVIDAGHGGKDPGSISSGVREKDITLSIALKLGKLIKTLHPSIKVIYTRDHDEFIELSERSSIANREKADLFISIHCNHNGNQTANGTETYVMGTHKNEGNLQVAKRENAAILLEDDYEKSYEGFDPNSAEAHIIFSFYQNAFMEQSIDFASKVEHALSQRKTIYKSRGVKQAGFLVLWRTAMPSVLIESGFISNTAERQYLTTAKGQDEIAEALLVAFSSYKEEVEQ